MFIDRVRLSLRSSHRGATLIELVVFIVIMSVGIAGLLSTMSSAIRFSPEPMLQKQLTAVAESLLAEILHQPFTYCDPDDANAATATLSGTTPSCALVTSDQNKGGAVLTSPTSAPASLTETRTGVAPGTQFDNVADYGGYGETPVTDVTGGNAMAGYTAAVAVDRVGAAFGAPDGAVLRVTVSVSRDGQSFSLAGYRFRYAPRY